MCKSNQFSYIMETLQETIKDWDYYVNWDKVFKNYNKFKIALNTLNSLIGSENFEQDAKEIFLEYPSVIESLPILLAVREQEIKICKLNTLEIESFLFNKEELSHQNVDKYITFLVKSGLKDIFYNKKVKSIPDYVIGIEVGLDTNARKNRSGSKMETIVAGILESKKNILNFEYIEQASQSNIFKNSGIDIPMDKSNRIIDFAIFKNNKIYLLEANFYHGAGSKLKSTATEYIEISNRFNNSPNIKYGWVTDGYGWKNTDNSLQEFFNNNQNLMNLHILKNGGLEKFLSE